MYSCLVQIRKFEMSKLFVWFAVLLLSLQNTWAFCLGPYEDSFGQAQDVYLAEVLAVNPNKEATHATSAQIKVIRIYKSKNIGELKQLDTLFSSSKWWGHTERFMPGTQYLLYDHPRISSCQQFDNGMVSPDKIKLFEKEHAPIWIAPDR